MRSKQSPGHGLPTSQETNQTRETKLPVKRDDLDVIKEDDDVTGQGEKDVPGTKYR